MSNEPLFNPMAAGFLQDPYPFYERLRTQDPWHLSPYGFFVVSRYADVNFVLRDPRFEKQSRGPKAGRLPPEVLNKAIFKSIAQFMLEKNPPDHGRIRSCFAEAFSRRRVEAMRVHIETVVDKIVDELRPRGRMDVMQDFALHVPLTTITDILGVPSEHRDLLFTISRFSGRISDPVPLDPREIDQVEADFLIAADCFRELIELRRRRPGEDLISHVVQAAGDQISIDELVANLVLVFVAGHETTANILGNALIALARHPDQLQLLRDNPTLIGGAVTECLRYDASVQIASRTAKEKIVVGDATIAEGQDVLILLGSANRDGTVFENPDRLDIERRDTQLASFGGGIHYCLGAQLSRVEIEYALGKLLADLPGFALEDASDVQWRNSIAFRGPEHLAASWRS